MKEIILGSRYKVLKYIAKGGFGTTYLAEDTQLPGNDLCVVKQLCPSSQAPSFLNIARRLFQSEASALHSLGHHDRIPELLAYFEESEKFYLVQQYIEGKTLEQELNTSEAWSQTQVSELLQDCLEILEFIHAQGVIHRDIKPANLIRRHLDHKFALVDFGTVKIILQEQTKVGQLTIAVGTKGYMPVEQARGQPRPTSDIYALGIIGIEALTKVEPLSLEEDEDGELMWSHLADVSSPLAEILTKMTKCNHEERYQSAQEAKQALADLTQTIATASTSDNINKSFTERIGTARLTTFTSSAISDLQPVAASAPTIAEREDNSFANQDPGLSLAHQSTTNSLHPNPNTKTVPAKPNKAFWKIALAFGIIALGSSYFWKRQFMTKPPLETPVAPNMTDSKTPRVRQGEGFRKNL